MNTAFWREDEPVLAPEESKLLDAVYQAHAKSALRENVSTVALKHAAAGSGRLETALIAALASIGGSHAPIAEIYRFLKRLNEEVLKDAAHRVANGAAVPGWGNSFFKGRPDPDWYAVRDELDNWPGISGRITAVTQFLHSQGKHVYPNAGCFTAAAAIVVGMPAKMTPYLLIRGRLEVWTSLATDQK